MLTRKTVLRRLVAARADAEELKNEINLFYVACTRAMCSLHILAEEAKPLSVGGAADARCYADMFDIGKFFPAPLSPHAEFSAAASKATLLYRPDERLVNRIEERFSAPYGHAGSIDLPVKSSASAILKMSRITLKIGFSAAKGKRARRAAPLTTDFWSCATFP